jgi:DNA invertase Pin-like site-specific DNA recombinase
MAVLGYARVTTNGQNLTGQVAELQAARCVKIYREKASGSKTDRPELAKLLRALEPGDVLIVTRLDRWRDWRGTCSMCWTRWRRRKLASVRSRTHGRTRRHRTAD